MIFWINNLLNNPSALPFDINKITVLVGKGKVNRERFLFNLEKVNLIFLNHQPAQWMIDYYRAKYPGAWNKSIFSFIHPAHYREIRSVDKKFMVPVITFKDGIEGIRKNNVSVACLDWLCGIKNICQDIYFVAFDMGNELQWFKIKNEWVYMPRNWKPETRFLRSVLGGHPDKIFKFITFNRFLPDIMTENSCREFKEKLIEIGVITIELSEQDIARIYLETGTKKSKDLGEILKERDLKKWKMK